MYLSDQSSAHHTPLPLRVQNQQPNIKLPASVYHHNVKDVQLTIKLYFPIINFLVIYTLQINTINSSALNILD